MERVCALITNSLLSSIKWDQKGHSCLESFMVLSDSLDDGDDSCIDRRSLGIHIITYFLVSFMFVSTNRKLGSTRVEPRNEGEE
jgi:hypothetical protein